MSAFFFDLWNALDALIVCAWIITISVPDLDVGLNPTLLRLARLMRLLRLLRLVKTVHLFDSLYLMTTAITGSLTVVVWTVLVLALVQMCIAMILQSLVEDYIRTEGNLGRAEVFQYYGSFARSFLTMFELTLGNWMPPTRALVEHVSEWYMIFFLLHKFVIGFSVTSVITAVFIQETFNVATSDDQIMVNNTTRAMRKHEKKMTDFFIHADSDGNGTLDREEFLGVLQCPVVKKWLASMDLHVEDGNFLFELCHGGKGTVNATQLVRGAGRLKGTARHIDLVQLKKEQRDIYTIVHQMSEQWRGLTHLRHSFDKPEPVLITRESWPRGC